MSLRDDLSTGDETMLPVDEVNRIQSAGQTRILSMPDFSAVLRMPNGAVVTNSPSERCIYEVNVSQISIAVP